MKRIIRVVVAEGFVYAPETDKRNFMRRIEAAFIYVYVCRVNFEEPVTETLDIPKEKKLINKQNIMEERLI